MSGAAGGTQTRGGPGMLDGGTVAGSASGTMSSGILKFSGRATGGGGGAGDEYFFIPDTGPRESGIATKYPVAQDRTFAILRVDAVANTLDVNASVFIEKNGGGPSALALTILAGATGQQVVAVDVGFVVGDDYSLVVKTTNATGTLDLSAEVIYETASIAGIFTTDDIPYGDGAGGLTDSDEQLGATVFFVENGNLAEGLSGRGIVVQDVLAEGGAYFSARNPAATAYATTFATATAAGAVFQSTAANKLQLSSTPSAIFTPSAGVAMTVIGQATAVGSGNGLLIQGMTDGRDVTFLANGNAGIINTGVAPGVAWIVRKDQATSTTSRTQNDSTAGSAVYSSFATNGGAGSTNATVSAQGNAVATTFLTNAYALASATTHGSSSGTFAFYGSTGNCRVVLYQNNEEKVGIDNDGVYLGPVGALATNAVRAWPYMPNSAGAPTGVPASLPVGKNPFQYDETNHKLWIYDQGAGAWKGVVLA